MQNSMKLTVTKREKASKAEARRLRRDGKIPAVIYSKGHDGQMIVLEAKALDTYLRDVKSGELATARFLLEGDGIKIEVLIKEIQYHPTSYAVEHVDFLELRDDTKINVRVPLRWVNMAECAGIKLGGVLRPVIRSMPVRCLPKDLPICFEVDVREMVIAQSKRLSSIEIPANVRALCDLNEVAVVIAKR